MLPIRPSLQVRRVRVGGLFFRFVAPTDAQGSFSTWRLPAAGVRGTARRFGCAASVKDSAVVLPPIPHWRPRVGLDEIYFLPSRFQEREHAVVERVCGPRGGLRR
jgi:hypothetical protein